MLAGSTKMMRVAGPISACGPSLSRMIARAMSVDATKGVPTAPFQRPKGAIWSDKQGHEHETAAVKARMELYTGDSSSRIPPDPYAPPHVTPAQSRKLSGIQKDSASEMKNILRKWNTDAYESVDSAISEVTARAKTQEETACFSRMLRRWNDQAYAGVDKEQARRVEMREGAKAMAGILRSISPKSYENVDKELGGCKTSGVPKAEFRRGGKGVVWEDGHGTKHETPVAKKKMEIHTGDSSELPPPDPYRANAP